MFHFRSGQQQKDHVVTLSPLPHCGGEENGKKKAKLVGGNKDSLTEQQTKQTLTTITLIRRIYKTNPKCTEQLSPSEDPCAPDLRLTSASQLPHSELSMTTHGIEYPIFWSVRVSRPVCVPSWLLVKINPVLAEPRTHN